MRYDDNGKLVSNILKPFSNSSLEVPTGKHI